MGSANGKMGESSALHVHKRGFTSGMHDFEYERLAVGSEELEIVVVFAGERASGCLYAEKLLDDVGRFGGRDGRGDACFREHERNCIGGTRVRPNEDAANPGRWREEQKIRGVLK
jgi:hypothetical protein